MVSSQKSVLVLKWKHINIVSNRIKMTCNYLSNYRHNICWNSIFPSVHKLTSDRTVFSNTASTKKNLHQMVNRKERINWEQERLGVQGINSESLRAWATQSHWEHTVARIKIRTKGCRKVILREGVDGEAMVGDIVKGDCAGIIV